MAFNNAEPMLKKLKTYALLTLASVLTVVAVTFFLSISGFSQQKGVKHAKIYTIDLRTKIPYLPTEQTSI
jgi:hypothetical protein